MDEAEFDAFLGAANAELKEKQAKLRRDYGIGSYPRWWFEQRTGVLQFLDHDGRACLEAVVIHIGSYAPSSNTWKWGWANDSVLPSLRQRAEPLKQLAEITGMDLFDDATAFPVEDESMAWELTAMSVKHLDVLGCYRAPATEGEVQMFLGLREISRISSGAR